MSSGCRQFYSTSHLCACHLRTSDEPYGELSVANWIGTCSDQCGQHLARMGGGIHQGMVTVVGGSTRC